MKEYIIKANDAGQRLDKFILKLAPKLPKPLLHKAIRKKDIKLNGKTTQASVILVENDLVELYLHSKFFAEKDNSFLLAPSSLNIIYEDDNLIVVNKPSGILMHQGIEKSKDNLTNRLLHYLYKTHQFMPDEEQGFSPAFCSRLDRNTKGLVLAAKNFPSLQLLNQKMKDHEIIKKYLCLVEKEPFPKSATLKSFYFKDQQKNKAIISPEPKDGFSPIETRYKVLETLSIGVVLEVELITGRSHQIRAHLASIGHPIIGDFKYDGTHSFPFQQLIAYYIGFNFISPSGHLSYLNEKSFQIPSPF